MQNLLTIVGERIKIARKNRGLTQTQLGKIVDMPQPYIAGIEKGEKNISIETLEKLVNALDIDPTELFIPFTSAENVKKAVLSDKIKLLINSRSVDEVEIINKLLMDVFSAIDDLKK